ncbi:transglutaminase family protein [Xylophilus rhododendri]|uniref:Transglutaminase family protein n=1 Tax=Xylophilus rhododendri TaxID=2697032 RepID=A0A857J408_9BURK|nr:transglutaminase family protein [Xylophilus rhododendri]QHI97781.1 transglutaminase family protein [Xylophilus rhododendri]
MKLFASCALSLHVNHPTPVVAILRPRSGLAQWLESERYRLEPWVPCSEFVDVFGNLCQRFTVPPGGMRVAVEMEVMTEDEIAVDRSAPWQPVATLPDDVLHHLLPSRYCPSDRMEDHAWKIVGDASPGYGQVEAVTRWIHENVEYRYGTSDASTDACDTLAKRQGVCRDFAHVGVSLCRALKIPARMVVGYLWKLDPMDLHAWFEAFLGGRWYTFDATQAAPRGGRIVLAYGRDAADVAFISDYGKLPLSVADMEVEVRRLDEQPAAKAKPVAAPTQR